MESEEEWASVVREQGKGVESTQQTKKGHMMWFSILLGIFRQTSDRI